MGFRGERKGILTPFTYSPIRRLLPRRGGYSDGKRESYLNHILSYSETSPKERGSVVAEKGILTPSLSQGEGGV